MSYFYTALGSLAAGVVLTRLYYNKIIALGKAVYVYTEKDAEKAWRFIANLPAKIGKAL